MAVFERLSRAFQKRRKKTSGSSRRWAIRAKKTKTSVILTPDITANIKLNRNDKTVTESVETRSNDDKQLSSSSRSVGFLTVSSIVWQCRRVFSQFWTGFWNHFLFWRGYAQRVEMLHQKVEDLQREICLLRSSVQMAHGPSSSGCRCGKPGALTVLQQHQDNTDAPVPALPPPPLPPPPPPPPPPPTTMQLRQKLSLIPGKRTKRFQEKVDQRAAVTLQDLQAVQLRKVTVNPIVRSPKGRRSPLITLADLQKVRLRRTQSFSSPLKPSLGRASVKSPTKLRVQLKKVHINRSPGGTPLCNKENLDSCMRAIMNQA